MAIDADLEATARRRDKLERLDALLEFEKLFRQTDGVRLVVSDRAILDGNLKGHSALGWEANPGAWRRQDRRPRDASQSA